MVPPKLSSKVSASAKPPADWLPDSNQSSRRPKESQAVTAKNRTYFQCSDCSQIITQLGDLGRHWKLDLTNHTGTWFTERAHMFKRRNEEAPHVEYYCVGKSGNTNIWKRCNNQALTDGEDQSDLQSLIDQEGNKYNYHNSNGLTTFVRAPDALRGKRPESGDEDDEEHGDTTLTKSNRSRRGAGRRESSRQVGIGNNLNVETSSENNVDDLAMNQDASTDNLESQDHMNPFKNEEEGRSRSFIDKTNTTGDTNSLESAPPTRRQSSFQLERDHNITDNTIAAARLEHAFEHGDMELDEDDNEHPDSLNDRNLALELPRETAAEEECTRPTQRTPKSSAQWHGVDQSLLKNQFINAYTFPNHDLPSGFQSTNPYPGYGDPMSQDNRVEPLRGIPPMQGLRQAQATIRKSSSATGLDEVTPEVKAESSYDRDMPPPNPSHSNPPRNPKTQPRNPRCIRASSLRQHPSPSSIEPTHHSASQVPDATAEGAASETRAKRLHHVRDRSPTREN